MKKPRILLHLAALAMGLCLLAGCAAQPAAPAQATIPHIETSPQPTVAPSPTPTQAPAQQQDLQQVYGSCGLLAWPSVLYSIYRYQSRQLCLSACHLLHIAVGCCRRTNEHHEL